MIKSLDAEQEKLISSNHQIASEMQTEIRKRVRLVVSFCNSLMSLEGLP
jgi:hypothetical protein